MARFRRRRPVWPVLVGVILVVAVSSCRVKSDSPEPELMLFAAASTADAVRAVVTEFEHRHRVRIRCNFASSATLAQQIRAGAGADLFLSAHPEWVDLLERENRLERRATLIENELVVVVPAGTPLAVSKPADLLDPMVHLVSAGEPGSVPAGTYARAAMERLGLWQSLLPKLVTAVDVRQVLAYVESGEVDAGFVYATDAAITAKVRVACVLGPDLTGRIEYPIVLLSGRGPAAGSLYEFACSSRALEIFRQHGFKVGSR